MKKILLGGVVVLLIVVSLSGCTDIKANNPPNTPTFPYPADGANDIPLNPTLQINISDADGDAMDIVWFSNVSGSWEVIGINNSVYDGVYLMPTSNFTNFETTYFWNVSITDSINTVYSPNYRFTTASNNPPNKPNLLTPANQSVDIDINTELNWLGDDPDGDLVSYDVYFGNNSSPPKVSNNQTMNTYSPGTLNYYTTYYWKIVSWDNHGAYNSSEIWKFTTKNIPINTLVLNPLEYLNQIVIVKAYKYQGGWGNVWYISDDSGELLHIRLPDGTKDSDVFQNVEYYWTGKIVQWDGTIMMEVTEFTPV